MFQPPAAPTIAGLTLQNAGVSGLQAGVTTLGHVFQQGDVPSGQALWLRAGGSTVPVQMDVKTRHEDGSVKMAVLAFERPALEAGASLAATLGTAPPAAAQPAVDLAAVSARHALTVELAPVGGARTTVDVMAALREALNDGSASVWKRGPLATEARVEIDLPGSMRLKFDVTAFRDGQISVDAVFANDQAMGASGGRVAYDVVARLNGREVIRESVNHGQYQSWHREFESSEAHGGQGLGAPSRGWLNIRHDVAYLKETGAIANYDLSIPIPATTLAGYGNAISAPGWAAPLAANGVVQSMGSAGGRPDLGFTTEHNVVWLLSGDARAAGYALGQAQASGSAPWSHWDTANGTWLNTDNYPRLWVDGRGGVGRPGDPASGGLTQQVDGLTGWGLARSHQPELAFVPYVLTGERWILDNLNAQSSWAIMTTAPEPRQNAADNMLNGSQVRSSAWSLRQLENAAWINPDGSVEKAYFSKAAADNWAWLIAQLPKWTEMQGEAHGWLPGVYGADGMLPPWQQDYFAGIVIISASRGNQEARTVLDWMKNFLVGRFTSEDKGFFFRDGVAYNIAIADTQTGIPYKTWAEIGAATVARNASNGAAGWSQSEGEYARLGLATLAGLHAITGDPEIASVYRRLLAEKPPFTAEVSYSARPAYGVTIADIYDTIHPPGGAGSVTAPPPPPPIPDLKPIAITLGQGSDVLVLNIAQDHFRGSAEYTVAVNGQAVGGTLTASALKGSGAFDTVTLRGTWGGTVSLSVSFLNDAWDGTPQTDRNLYILGATLNGRDTGIAADLFQAGTRSFTLASAPPLPPALPPPTTALLREGDAGANTLTGGAGADILRGRAGNDVLAGGAGADTVILARGDGADRVTDFTPGTDRLLFDGIAPGSLKAMIATIGGRTGLQISYGPGTDSVFLEGVRALRPGDLAFANVPPVAQPAAPPAPTPGKAPPGFAPVSLGAGTGPDAIVLRIAQDAWRGSAQYTVEVDGRQVGGVFTASALKSSGLADTLTLRGNWDSDVAVVVRFRNDAFGGTAATDRNLHVEGIAFNGHELAGMRAPLWSGAPVTFSVTEPAAPRSLSFGTGPDTLVLRIAQDFWEGPAQYTVSVNGQQVGGVLTASAIRAHGQADTITIKGSWGETVGVSLRFLNDAYGGVPTADRNLHLAGATLNGSDLGVSMLFETSSSRSFTASKPVPLPDPVFAALRDGDGGANTLSGGAGHDILRGRAGNDVLTGGAGPDTFLFARGDGADRVTDFASGADRLFLLGIDPATVKSQPTTVGGQAGLLVTYGPGTDSIFLAGVSKLATGDLVFG